jgi:hypothetical protein
MAGHVVVCQGLPLRLRKFERWHQIGAGMCKGLQAMWLLGSKATDIRRRTPMRPQPPTAA